MPPEANYRNGVAYYSIRAEHGESRHTRSWAIETAAPVELRQTIQTVTGQGGRR